MSVQLQPIPELVAVKEPHAHIIISYNASEIGIPTFLHSDSVALNVTRTLHSEYVVPVMLSLQQM